jgi:hypothetical protein
MTSRTPGGEKRKVTLVAVAVDKDGEPIGEVRYRTAAGYDWAGVAQANDGRWALLAKGWDYASVKARTGRTWRRQRHPNSMTGAFYRSGWQVVPFRKEPRHG